VSRDPLIFSKGEHPRGNQAMEVEMVHKDLRPGVEHGNEPNFARKVPGWVFGKCLKRFIDCGKENLQGDSFVAEDKGIKLMRQGKDQVKIATGKQLSLAVIEPLFFDQGLAFGAMSVPA